MILDARKGKNASMMFYLKVKRYDHKLSKTQETNNNIPEEKKPNDDKEDCSKNLGLPSEMDINVIHQYSYLGAKLLRITYNALGVKLTGTLQVCDVCARSKENAHHVRKKSCKRASWMGENIFVDTTGLFLESLIRNWYWIGVVDECSRYSWIFFTNTKLQLRNKM